ncbi:MAG: PKD domain-containing protein [Saprospiraceae bacterium]|nr:PKD domain-containing protein [Saprospiraceae bacterium]
MLRLLSYFSFLVILVLGTGCARTVANFSKTLDSKDVPVKVNLTNESKNAESYIWDFGDGTRSDEESPTHTYNSSGTYVIKLMAKKGKKEVSASQVIEVMGTSKCLVEMSTEFGKVIIELSDETPQHRDNFIKLVEDGYYEDLLFHRVIDGFMIQGGDPQSRKAGPDSNLGSGGPGYLVPAEFRESLAHVKGAIAAARTGGPGNPEKESSGSQFYIVHGQPVSEGDIRRNESRRDMYYSPQLKEEYLEKGGTPFLDGEYTVFGKVISGLEVIDKLAAVETDGDPPRGQSRPKENLKMNFKIVD